ncbi:hypothetical protein HPP92_019728 [Vanilla planifolia]|uniref:Uncharacterized protein n=1 Tax=Vanilla planifolia TaxID=51239 RepID=A0A835UJL0_VANPL|nr:hypothetical protein HPP92_020161 [Vanilla planifolia]KAG0465564.1 hypothetical protein HPP92_019728 [Vanilla planifolia]
MTYKRLKHADDPRFFSFQIFFVENSTPACLAGFGGPARLPEVSAEAAARDLWRGRVYRRRYLIGAIRFDSSSTASPTARSSSSHHADDADAVALPEGNIGIIQLLRLRLHVHLSGEMPILPHQPGGARSPERLRRSLQLGHLSLYPYLSLPLFQLMMK